MLNTTTEMPTTLCPGCGTDLSAATALVDGERPAHGDYSVCVACTSMLVYTESLTVRLLEPEEFTAMDPETAELIGQIRAVMVQAKEDHH